MIFDHTWAARYVEAVKPMMPAPPAVGGDDEMDGNAATDALIVTYRAKETEWANESRLWSDACSMVLAHSVRRDRLEREMAEIIVGIETLRNQE